MTISINAPVCWSGAFRCFNTVEKITAIGEAFAAAFQSSKGSKAIHSLKLQRYESVQLGSTNHCESVTVALMQMKVTTGGLERQQKSLQKVDLGGGRNMWLQLLQENNSNRMH